MRVSIERVPLVWGGTFPWSKPKIDPVKKMLHFNIEFTEEERHIIKLANLGEQEFFRLPTVVDPRYPKMGVINLDCFMNKAGCNFDVAPREQNELEFGQTQQMLEDAARMLKQRIDSFAVTINCAGNKTFEL